MSDIATLVGKLHNNAAWEDEGGAKQHAAAIAKIGGEAAVAALIGVLEKMAAVDLADDAGDMSDECWRASSAAEHGLGLLGAIAVPRLVDVVQGAPSRARSYAARALGATRDPRALQPLLDLADDEEERWAALAALGKLGDPSALPILREAIRPRDVQNHAHERAIAATAIGALRHPDSVALLRSMLSDPDWYARYHACEALVAFRTPEAREALKIAARDSDERVARRAIR